MFLIPASSLQLIWTSTAQSEVLRAASAWCWFSLPHLVSNWLNFLCTELYNSTTSTFFLWASQITLIHPAHGQGYILIFLNRMHLLFTPVHFLFWQLGRVGGQYTTFWLYLHFKTFQLNSALSNWQIIFLNILLKICIHLVYLFIWYFFQNLCK